MSKTLFDKIWQKHVVNSTEGYPDLLYIDMHYIHEVTSPQAFDGLKTRNLPVFRLQRTLATADHNVPTKDQHLPIKEELSRKQVEKLSENCKEYGVELFALGHQKQGIVHVIGPELGVTNPGMTIVCGDSHTSTHGAFGAIAFGIGTSEVEMVLGTQCVLQYKPLTMKIDISGKLGKGVTAKDIILYVIAQISASGGNGYAVEYSGSAIRALSMEARMTICNMSIEMGARCGLIAPDQITFDYIEGKERAPKGNDWDKSLKEWKTLYSDLDAKFDKVYAFEAENIEPMVTYGTNPGMGLGINENIPLSKDLENKAEVASFIKSLDYMGLTEGQAIKGQKIDYVFIGSCTNSRIEDLRAAANLIKGKQKSASVIAWIIPGSKMVEKQAKAEGLDLIFKEAGFDFREPGCSACLGMNEDKIPAGKYCISTSNRNFEGRQGQGARTLLASPIMAAAAALTGKVTDVRDFLN